MSEFFKDCNGKFSMMRLLAFIIIVGVIPLCYIHPLQAASWASMVVSVTVFKWAQKKGESK